MNRDAESTPARLSPDPRWLEMPLLQEWGWTVRREAGFLREHVNPGFEITFATEGEFVWEVIGGPRLRLTGGHVCVTGRDVPHRGAQDLFSPGTLFYLVLDPRADGATRHTPFDAETLVDLDGRLAQASNRVVRAHPELPSLFDGLRCSLEAVTRGSRDPLLRPWTQLLICQILVAAVRSFAAPVPEPESAPIRRALAFMDDDLAAPLVIDRLAERVGLSRSRFYAAFRDATGLTPADYLQRRRCARAAELLRTTDQTVTAIAMRCGFNTGQYFARCFRKYAGVSPSTYRKGAR